MSTINKSSVSLFILSLHPTQNLSYISDLLYLKIILPTFSFLHNMECNLLLPKLLKQNMGCLQKSSSSFFHFTDNKGSNTNLFFVKVYVMDLASSLFFTCISNPRDFQEGPRVPIFLLTTQVGGFGLPLTKVAHVIVVDPAWSPRYLNNDNSSLSLFSTA
jgi:hypothetical protein